MFLRNIEFKNFCGFTDLELNFAAGEGNAAENRKTTILLGENGLGKSCVLKGVALVTAGRDSLPQILGEPKSWIQVGKRFCELNATLQTGEGQQRQVSLRIERGDGVSEVLDRAKESLQLLEGALDHTDRSYFVAAYGASRRLNTNRGFRINANTYSHPRAQRIISLFEPEATLTSIESWAIDMDYQQNRKATKTIKDVLAAFLKNVTFSRIDKAAGQLIFKTPLGEVPMSQLSDGYQNIAAWVGDLLFHVTSTFQDYQNPLATRGLLLIDEIDLHLHPKWQRALLRFLKDMLPNLQIVATTHSPITAQQANEGELHYLSREGKSAVLQPFEGDPRSLLINQLMTSELFGVESDESVQRQELKARYEKLTARKTRSRAQKKELEELEEELSMAPPQIRSNMLMSREHVDLLQKINEELGGKSS